MMQVVGTTWPIFYPSIFRQAPSTDDSPVMIGSAVAAVTAVGRIAASNRDRPQVAKAMTCNGFCLQWAMATKWLLIQKVDYTYILAALTYCL